MRQRPSQRCFPFSGDARLMDLGDAWCRSQSTIERLRQVLLPEPHSQQVACVVISGSLSRMEYHAASDLDLLVVVDDRTEDVREETAVALFNEVWRRIDAEGLAAAHPKSGGVFSQCVSWRALTNPAVRGIINEEVTTYGQRMQLLLDAQPVLHHGAFEELQAELLNWYLETRVSEWFDEAGPFGWLRQDVQRYWRSIWSRAYWLHADDAGKSMAVNVKLRSSRAAIVGAFLHAIDVAQNAGGETSDVVTTLQGQLRSTPLERLASALPSRQASDLLISYQAVWHFLSGAKSTDGSLPHDVRNALRALAGCLPSSVRV